MRPAGLFAAAVASLATIPASSAAGVPPPLVVWDQPQQVQQQPLLSDSPPNGESPPIRTKTSTLVDVLSADEDYTTLLRLLQRTQLVPALNALGNSTLWAPTNAAFEADGHPIGSSEGSLADWAWSPVSSLEQDNRLRMTRDRLLYHMLNFSLPLDPVEAEQPTDYASAKPHPRPSPPPPEEVPCRPRFPLVGGLPESLETLLYPRRPSGNDRPEKTGPWLPAPHGQLGPEGQRVRGVWRKRETSGLSDPSREMVGDDWVGVDGQGRGGVRVVGRPVVAGNGVVLKVDGVLDPPADVGACSFDVAPVGWLADASLHSQAQQ